MLSNFIIGTLVSVDAVKGPVSAVALSGSVTKRISKMSRSFILSSKPYHIIP